MRKLFTFLFALAASVGLMNAKVTWKSSNVSDLYVWGTDAYSKEGVTLRGNGDMVEAAWDEGYGDESTAGISFRMFETGGGFTFSNTLGKNFTKIEMSLVRSEGWDLVNLGSGWSFWESFGEGEPVFFVTWKGNASTVDLLKEASDFHAQNVKSIVFYFVGDSEAPDPTYTVALKDGTANADKVTLSKTSAVEGATVTVTPDEEYGITAFKATYNTTEELSTSFDPSTGAYSFTMPAANVTIEATIALKPVPEGDIFAGFTATAGSGGFNNEGHANLVDNKFTSGNEQTDWTKWCANNDNNHKSVPTGESGDACWWIDFEASAALNLTGYILTTGNDTGNEHGRNPKNWLLKAKLNAGDAWTTIATVTDDVTMKDKSFKDYKFFVDVDQSGSYQYFRFEVFANQGAGVMQLCELRLIGTVAPDPAPVAVTGVTLDQNEVQMTVGDETLMLTATVAPDDATDKTVVWTSSDPSVATVANGLVTAVAAGTATITATATNGTPDDTTDDFSATCDVTVSASSDEGAAGALPGKFSVSASQVVYFSRGNLQASTTDLGANWTWAFAKKQYSCVAANASNTAISGNGTVSTNGTVDLFGWSTAATQYGIHVKPFNSTYSGDFVDWGSNPDLIAALGTGWRTLTSDEWTYLLDTRTTASGVRYAKAEITDKIYPGTTTTIKGLIILPDDWSTDYHALASTNTADAAFTSNQITSTVWKNELEAHGAVFMPAAGYRMATSVYSYSERGYYWSATPNGAENAYELIFIGDNVYLADNGRRLDGHSVRLVTETAPAPPTYTVALKDGTVNADKVTLSATSVEEGATVTVTPNEEYEITDFTAYYVVVDGQLGTINEIDATLDPETGAYSFTMPAYDVTIEATIAEKAAPATTTVTWKSTDFTEEGTYTSHKGIEVNPGVEVIDIAMEVPDVTISGPGSFSTTNSNLVFTKIEVSGGEYDELSFEGEGWSDSEGKRVWEGQAATVPFNLGTIYTGDEGDVPWTIVFTLAPAPSTPTVYNSGSVALSNLKVGDILMAGVTLTDDSNSKVKFVPSRLKLMGNIRKSELTVANFVSSLQTPLLGENAAMTFQGGAITITPIDEEGKDGNAWEVTEIYVEADIPVTLAGITYSGTEPEPLADCELAWKDVPEGGVVGTIGHEDEINLPYFTASLDFMLALDKGTATLRLGSTDESVLTVYGFNDFAVNGVGECDVYIVHDEDAVFAYDSAAFHVTVNPEPAGKPIVVFEANGNKKEVEIESFPHTFWCSNSKENGELDLIIQELYGLSMGGFCDDDFAPTATGNAAVTAGKAGTKGRDHYITISDAFAGTATVAGSYYEWYQPLDEDTPAAREKEYSLTISIKNYIPTAIENVQTNQVQATKILRDGQLYIMYKGTMYNVQGARVK